MFSQKDLDHLKELVLAQFSKLSAEDQKALLEALQAMRKDTDDQSD